MRGKILPVIPACLGAAPDLLAAAKLALNVAESQIHDEYDGTSMLNGLLQKLEPVRAAIVKAEGPTEVQAVKPSALLSEAQAREALTCVGCGKPKDKGLVVCWACFKHRTDVEPLKYYNGTFERWQLLLEELP